MGRKNIGCGLLFLFNLHANFQARTAFIKRILVTMDLLIFFQKPPKSLSSNKYTILIIFYDITSE